MQCTRINAFKLIVGSLSMILITPNVVLAKEYFDPNMLNIGDGNTKIYNNEDLSLFNDLDSLPGDYKLDVFINNNRIEHRSVYLYASKNNEEQQLVPCFQQNELEHYGVKTPAPVAIIQLENGQQCADWSSLSYAQSRLDLHNNQLLLQFPQAHIVQERIDYFERKHWDNGIPALRLDYSVSEFSNRNNSRTESSTFASLQSSVNWGAWRLRQNSTWTHDVQGNDQWKNLSTTLSRNIPIIDSEIILGDNYSSSAIFEGVKIRGAILQSDPMMRPRKFNSYAPGISGIADSESIISIYQNSNLIYKKSVPAGPFYITDYNPLTNGGNMTVEITGIDGQTKKQIVPFTSLAFLERKGNLNYHVALGQYNGDYDNDHEFLTQAEVTYGLTDYITIAAGSQLSQHYQAFSFGQGVNLGKFGAVSANVVHAISDFEKKANNSGIIIGNEEAITKEGNAFKLNYSKSFTPTNTSLNFAGYKYFSSGFYNFNDVMRYNSDSPLTNNITDPLISLNDKIKHQYNVTMLQNLPNQWGSISLNASSYNYRDHRDLQSYNLGYLLSKNKINYGLYYTYYNDSDTERENSPGKYSISFNVSMPLSFGKKPVYASYNIGRSVNGQNNQIVQLNGLAGDRLQASWNAYQGYDDKNYGGLSGSYNSPFAHLNAGYSYRGNDQHNMNANIAGTFVATQYGALMSKPLQGTNALIVTKNVGGIKATNSATATTTKTGLAIYPGLSPYRKNQIALDTQSIPENAEIEETIISQIIPTKGALILADFKARQGYKLLLTLHNDGLDIPMGAKATLTDNNTAMVASFNQVYLLSEQEKGSVNVNWVAGNQAKNCVAQFDLTTTEAINGLYLVKAACIEQQKQTTSSVAAD